MTIIEGANIRKMISIPLRDRQGEATGMMIAPTMIVGVEIGIMMIGRGEMTTTTIGVVDTMKIVADTLRLLREGVKGLLKISMTIALVIRNELRSHASLIRNVLRMNLVTRIRNAKLR